MTTAHIGQPVLFYREGFEGVCLDATQPMAATVCFVGRPERVNLRIVDHKGNALGLDGVPYVSDGIPPASGNYCTPFST